MIYVFGFTWIILPPQANMNETLKQKSIKENYEKYSWVLKMRTCWYHFFSLLFFVSALVAPVIVNNIDISCWRIMMLKCKKDLTACGKPAGVLDWAVLL